MGWFGKSDERDSDTIWNSYVQAGDDLYQAKCELAEAEQRYADAERELFGIDLLPVLRKALRKYSLSALGLLGEIGEEQPELVRALIPELYACSLGIGKPDILARGVLRTLSRSGSLHAELVPLVTATLRDTERTTDVFAMRGLAFLLEDVNDPALLGRWRRTVLVSADEDVREIAEDYPEDEFPEPAPPQQL
ncbi:hypothetical protein [Streptomyces sp. NPDC020681]|uniref:hypothetical protein n=1 Tax=Streptomyces sp. NPDC020681 TaxID=3365083 RepID=UPI00378FD920